jgi:hypothetical protein
LKGKRKQARHIVVHDASRLEEAPVKALIIQALRAAKLPVEPKSHHGQSIIKSISMKQRPRPPSGARRSAKSPVPIEELVAVALKAYPNL